MKGNLKDKKILLIGGAGFIGLHLAERLSKINGNVTIYCKNPDKAKKIGFAEKIRFVKGDVANYKDVEESIKNKDIIINLASVINPGSSFEPYCDLEVNCKGQINILEARKKVNPNSKYIFLGTRVQFGRVKESDLPVSEEHCQRPISLYGIHKQTAENYCKLYKTAFNLKSIVLRLSIVYGHDIIGDNKYNIINKFIKTALKNEKFYVHGYGKDLKDLIYIDDLTDLIVRIIESDIEEGIFNAGSGEKIRLIDVAKKVVELCKSGSFEAVQFPAQLEKIELGSFYFDISKVKRTFGWEPHIKVEEGLKRTIEFYKNKVMG